MTDQFTPAWKTEPAQADRRERADRERRTRSTPSSSPTTACRWACCRRSKQAGIAGRQDPRHRAGHGAVGDAGDRRGPHVRQRLAGARRDGHARRRRSRSPWPTASRSPPTRPSTTAPARFPGRRRRSTWSTRRRLAKFVCDHPFWISADEVYKNVPDQEADLLTDRRRATGSPAPGGPRGRRRCAPARRAGLTKRSRAWSPSTTSPSTSRRRDRGPARPERRRQVDADPGPRRRVRRRRLRRRITLDGAPYRPASVADAERGRHRAHPAGDQRRART